MQGRPSPEAMMHFPPVSDFPPISEQIFTLRGKCSQFYLFRKKISIFIRQNFSRPSLVIHPKFATIPPYFAFSIHWFRKIYVFYVLYMFFVSPPLWPWCIYASHNARTGRPWTEVSKDFDGVMASLRISLLASILSGGKDCRPKVWNMDLLWRILLVIEDGRRSVRTDGQENWPTCTYGGYGLKPTNQFLGAIEIK